MNHFSTARFVTVVIACLAVATCFATRSQADTPAILTATNNGASVTNSSIVGNFDVNIGWSFTVGATTLGNQGYFGPTFQSISAINVPEASTFAFALPALGIVGAVVLRRRKK